MTAPTPQRPSIDFPALLAELLAQADSLVPQWLPGGTRDGPEYKGLKSSSGGPGDSWVVNLVSGKWAHFAGDDRGNDLLSLYAVLHGFADQVDAALQLIADHALHACLKPGSARPAQGAARASKASGPAPEKPPAKPAKNPGERGEFLPMVPVPDYAPPPPKRHGHRGEPTHVWRYMRDGALYGCVYRFTTSDGGKVVFPCVWAASQVDGSQKWTWKHWEAPKPLYLPGGTLRAGVPRVVVEGEKCADALHALLGADYDVLSWPGGTKATDKAAWDWLLPAEGDTSAVRVILWPDADYKRRKLSTEERAGSVPPDTVDYLPAIKQPGLSAMHKIADTLHAQGARVWLCDVPDPPATPDLAPPLPDGWDCADAIASGWDADKCRAHLQAAVTWAPPDPDAAPAATAAGQTAKRSAGASEASGPDPDDPKAWRIGLLKTEQGAIRPARENVVLALQSLPETRAKIVYNEFTNDIIKLAAMPWGSPAGKWTEVDELHMGEWLVRRHWLPSMPRTTLEEGMRMVAMRNQYHPVREYLQGIKWDGKARLNDWLILAVVAEPERLSKRKRMYLQRVGAWMLMGMVARAMRPGCKFDYMPIFEGAQGRRKSTVLAVLAGDWFADTGFNLGEKDSLQMLQGRWLYEISELDAMARAEVTKIKAFIASRADWYRASFDKRPREYPRQLIFAGTTNEHHYLVDGTGNRRFWPIEVTRTIDTDMVARDRDQLFAEAWARVNQGDRYHPNTREELELFLPEQRARMVESPIEMKLLDYLVNQADGQLITRAESVKLLAAINIDITKLGPGRFHEKQVGTAMRRFGWERKKSSRPGRPWEYVKPEGWPECMQLDDLDDDEPAGKPTPPAPGPATESINTAPERADYDDGSNEPF